MPHFNFAPLHNALGRLDKAAGAYDEIASSGAPASAQVNNMLYTSERLLTREGGLPGRSWYKHHIYAPGFYTGYGVKTLPGVREAIEEREFDQVEIQIVLAAEIIDGLSERIEAIVDRESDAREDGR